MPRDGDGQLVAEDVVLGFEVGGLDAEDALERGLGRFGERGEQRVLSEKLV